MTHSKACCSLPPVASNYAPVGEMITIDDLAVYTVGPNDATKSVLVFYDIFGYHNNTKQFCDILAKSCGWKVVMPDFFHGKPLTPDAFKDMPKALEWIHKHGAMETVLPDIERTEAYLKNQGVTASTLVGFCWGAKIAVQLTSTHPFFVGASCIHPSFVDVKDAEKAGAPVLSIASMDEPDMTEYLAVLSKKPFGDKCKVVRFDDMVHGFCATRGNYEDELNAKRANEAIELTVDFYTECFEYKASL